MSTEREQRYLHAIQEALNCCDGSQCSECTAAVTAAVAIADEEQAELRAEVERLTEINRELVEAHNVYLGVVERAEAEAAHNRSAARDFARTGEAAEAEVARLTTLLEQRTAALTRTIDAKNAAEAKVTNTARTLDALIETIANDDSGEPVCHDYDRIDDGECALLADLRRARATLDGGQP